MSDPQQPQVPPYAQPQHPASGRYSQPAPHPQGYVLNGNSAQPGYPVPVANGNPPGRIGFIFGLIGIAVGLVANLATNILIYSGGYYAVEASSWVSTLFVLAIAGLALGFGIAGLRRPNAPHGQAGIAVGIGLAMIVGSVGSVVINAVGATLFRYF
ncbi:hypothetical protein OED01_00835 [Microbacterium sp. M28]|uniref:hypothetical protein n=1 Tax=Microbacterium sp. M28 TaxID=2962064 RepID=UPI0021F467F0|nr:hypothetical protein [Microbacterium sp. M28]UYO97306.1 hypothetical protein OED01_00835 [Microbacterium sp. M28]